MSREVSWYLCLNVSNLSHGVCLFVFFFGCLFVLTKLPGITQLTRKS